MAIDIHSHLIPKNIIDARNVFLENIGGEKWNINAWGTKIGPLNNDMFDVSDQLDVMHKQNFQMKVISLPPFLFGYQLKDNDGVRWTTKCNNALAATLKGNSNLNSFGIVPLQNPKAAIKEMRRCILELGMVGIEIGSNVEGENLDNPKYEEFFAAANELNCPILVHPYNTIGKDRLSNFYLRNLLGNPFDTSVAGIRLILAGYFEKYPNLRICLSHGGGTLPYIWGRVAHGIKVRPELKNKDSALPDNLYFDTIVHDERTLRFLNEIVGTKNLVLGTDFPFDMGENEPLELIRRASIDANPIIYENPKSFLGIKYER